MVKDDFLPKEQKDEMQILLDKLTGADDFKTPFTVDQKENVKEGYLLLSKGLLTKQNRVQEAEEKISIRKDTPSKTSSNNGGGGGGGGGKNDNIILANDPATVTNNLKKLREKEVGEIKMYLNIGGTTSEYTVMHSPKNKGYTIYKDEGDEGTPMYGENLEGAAADAVRSLSKAQKVSQALYNKRKKNKK
jgi:hypothetical protein